MGQADHDLELYTLHQLRVIESNKYWLGIYITKEYRALSFSSMFSVTVVSQLSFCFEFVFTYVAFEFLPTKKVKFHNSSI